MTQEHRAHGAPRELDGHGADEHDEEERSRERRRRAKDLGAPARRSELLERQSSSRPALGCRLGGREHDGGAADAEHENDRRGDEDHLAADELDEFGAVGADHRVSPSMTRK